MMYFSIYRAKRIRQDIMMQRKKGSVLVALSGGIDSAVTAFLLKEQGLKVEGLCLELLDDTFLKAKEAQRESARRISAHLGIKVHFLNRQETFYSEVVSYFFSTYQKGLTPNPCIFCNPRIKFKEGLSLTRRLALDLFATGHYARIGEHQEFGIVLMKGADIKKDQSYFLHRLDPKWLRRILFPLGALEKARVKEIARSSGLGSIVLKESQEVCFIEGDYRMFIKRMGKEINCYSLFEKGPIILKRTGEVVGTHKGLFNYTVGQRRGLGIPWKEPYYVLRLDTAKNAVIIGTREEALRSSFLVSDVNWLVPSEEVIGRSVDVKIRSRHRPAPGIIEKTGSGEGVFRVEFQEPQPGVAPGQAAVFYLNDVVLGGGVICG